MEGLVSGILADPAVALGIGTLAGAVLTTAAHLALKHSPSRNDPLAGLFERETFEDQVRNAAKRAPGTDHTGSVLRGRIDHLSQVGQVWGQQSRAEAIEQVAQVMRAGVRKGDAVSPVYDSFDAPDPDGSFIIHTRGANEQEASGIAQRLLKTLARTPVPSMGDTMRVTASFGVAGRRSGESDAALRARADAALGVAQEAGEDQVVTASEWEEIKLLPPPSSPADESATKAA